MDEFGNRLSDDAITELFREKPPFINEELCNLFKLKMSLFEPYLPKDTPALDSNIEEIDKLYHEYFFERSEKRERRKKLEVYKENLDPELVNQIEEECYRKDVLKPKSRESYTSNNLDEEQLLTLAEVFQRQYRFLYPEGPRYFLFLPNEEGTMKIVCTTLCPYLCSRFELRNWKKCAEFVADYLEYLPLESPKLSPNFLASPEFILKARKGNSLDMSTVLCSFLLSAEYDAYVVQGYGRKALCEKDERDKPCPNYSLPTISEKYERFVKDQRKKAPELNKYEQIALKANVLEKRSNYAAMLRRKKFQEQIKIRHERKMSKERRKKQIEIETDPFYGQRVHFWVLVRPGKRDVKDAFFIETTTGEKRQVDDVQYMQIEFVWNNRNFWLNKQRSTKNCDLDFDFDNVKKWDYFIGSEEEISRSIVKLENENWVPMPQSWVNECNITFDDMQQVLPHNLKEIFYLKAKVEKFNPFFCPNGCALKKTSYEDDSYEKPTQIHEIFKNRSDRLIFRTTNLVKKEMVEFFEEGRDDGLKEHSFCSKDPENTRRVMTYYPMIRPDGLIKRTATKEQVFDIYSARTDFLSSKKVTYRVEQPTAKSNITDAKESENIFNTVQKEEISDNLITPFSFEDSEPILEGVDFEKWRFADFIQLIDPEYRYVSDSESDEDTVGILVDVPKEKVSEEAFNTEYKLFVSNLKDEIQSFGVKSLYPVYEELTESNEFLKSKKKSLKKMVAEVRADASTTAEKHSSKKHRRKLQEKKDFTSTIDAKQVFERHSDLQLYDWNADEEDNLFVKKKKGMNKTIIKRKELFKNRKTEDGRKLIVDINDKYNRNPFKEVEFDVLRRRYILDEGRYSILFHPLPGRLTFRGVVINKPVVKSLYHYETFDFTNDHFEEIFPGYIAKPFAKLYLYRELLLLMRSEAEAIKVASEIDVSITNFIETREREEQTVKLTASLSDTTMREETEVMREKEFIEKVFQACKEHDKLDYLTPALGIVGFQMPLNLERAEMAYNFMVKDSIVTFKRKIFFLTQLFLQTIREANNKRDEIKAKGRGTVDLKELVQHQKYCRKITTIFAALRMRCEWLGKPTITKYQDLKIKMFQDPRLQVFTSTLCEQ